MASPERKKNEEELPAELPAEAPDAEESLADATLKQNLIPAAAGSISLQIHDRSGRLVFEGPRETVARFIENKDYGDPSTIGDISNPEAGISIRFGARDGDDFFDRKRIPEVLDSLRREIIRDDQRRADIAKAAEILASVGETPELKNLRRISGEIQSVLKGNGQSLTQRLDLVGRGLDPDSDGEKTLYETVNPEVGRFFDAHGLTKGDQTKFLLQLLEHGIDPKRGFSSAPFELPIDERGGSTDSKGGVAYKDGMFVVTSGFHGNLAREGIRHVFVNDAVGEMKPELVAMFPAVKVHLLSEQKAVMEEEAREWATRQSS